MSYIYSVDGVLELNYDKKNLILVFERGQAEANFSYHVSENKGWQDLNYMEKLTPEQAAHKIILNQQEMINLNPIVRVLYNKEVINMHLFKTKSNQIEVSWSGLNPERKRYFPGRNYGMDFAYYIEKFVDLYSEFTIISLEASYF